MPRKLKDNIKAKASKVKEPLGVYYTADEVAKSLSVSKKTVHQWINDGRFSKVIRLSNRYVRIPEASVKHFLSISREEHKYANIV